MWTGRQQRVGPRLGVSQSPIRAVTCFQARGAEWKASGQENLGASRKNRIPYGGKEREKQETEENGEI